MNPFNDVGSVDEQAGRPEIIPQVAAVAFEFGRQTAVEYNRALLTYEGKKRVFLYHCFLLGSFGDHLVAQIIILDAIGIPFAGNSTREK